MRKILCILVLLAVALSVTACSDSEYGDFLVAVKTTTAEETAAESTITVAESQTEEITTASVDVTEKTTAPETTAVTTVDTTVTTTAPITTTRPPVTTAKPPVTTAKPPVTTTKPPVTTTKPPVVTTAVPVTTTPAPVTTTIPTTTAAPVAVDGILPLTASTPKSTSQSVTLEDQQRMLKLVNDLRASVGVAPLQLAEDVILSSQLRAEELIVNYNSSHNRPDGTLFSTIYKVDLGVAFHYVGENIGMGQQEGYVPNTIGGVSDPVEDFFEAWKNSPTHYKNMISEKYKYFGYGCAYKDGVYYVTQELITYWD